MNALASISISAPHKRCRAMLLVQRNVLLLRHLTDGLCKQRQLLSQLCKTVCNSTNKRSIARLAFSLQVGPGCSLVCYMPLVAIFLLLLF